MALLGEGAMTLWFDIASAASVEHDHWHTHEHLNERLSIPGFRRGTRWAAEDGSARYFVLYEVADLAVLESAAYLARLNDPSPWTGRMMPHYSGMTRALCRVVASRGAGLAQGVLTLKFSAAPGRAVALDNWIAGTLLPALAGKAGISGAHLLESALAPTMTREQQIRGHDQSVDHVLLVTAYATDALGELANAELRDDALLAQGMAAGFETRAFRVATSLTSAEAETPCNGARMQ